MPTELAMADLDDHAPTNEEGPTGAPSATPGTPAPTDTATRIARPATERRPRWFIGLAVAAVACLVAGFVAGRAGRGEEADEGPGPSTASSVLAAMANEYRPVAKDQSRQELERVRMEQTAIAFLHAWVTPGEPELRRRAMTGLAGDPLVKRLVNAAGRDTVPTGRPLAPPTMSSVTLDSPNACDVCQGSAQYATTLTSGESVTATLSLRADTGQWLVVDLNARGAF
jgi:hypothetical protein